MAKVLLQRQQRRHCVETASGNDVVLVRDTANRDGGTLSIPADAWARFTASLR